MYTLCLTYSGCAIKKIEKQNTRIYERVAMFYYFSAFKIHSKFALIPTFFMNFVVENHQCPLHCNWLRHSNGQKVAIMQNMGSVLKTKTFSNLLVDYNVIVGIHFIITFLKITIY